jgi:hypothetical protein
VSIGTQSLMHPVDWLEVNKRNGLHQALPEFDETAWFDVADLSILKTPHDRKSYPRRAALLSPDCVEEEEEEKGKKSGYVIHSVETDLVFAFDVPLSAKRAVLAGARENLAPRPAAETPWLGDEPLPFSTIKKESSGSGGLSRSLTRSKRSLFAVDIPRGVEEDDESEESLEI